MTESPTVDTSLVRAHGLAALATLLFAATCGLLASVQLWWPDLGAGVPALSWGRIRYAHTQGIMLGWLANAFLAFLYFAVPHLTGRPVTSARLGRWLFGLWNLAVMVPGWALVLAGVSQPLEWAEFPLVVDAMVAAGVALAIVQFVPPFFRRGLESTYVSGWYIIGALVFTALSYPMGNIVPELVPGAAGAAFSGLWIHDAVGLFVTPLALAILYYVIPAATGRPIYSHRLSMLGFWLLFLLYPLNGTHHYVWSVIPMPAQYTAIAASALLGLTVVLVVANLLLSLRGAGVLPDDLPLRFVVWSTLFYLVVSLQGSLQAFMTVNAVVHFTDWVIGHSHLAMLGFASFAAAGGLLHAWQRTPGLGLDTRAAGRGFWMLTAGLLLMVADLTVAGLVQAQLWQSGAPWLDSVTASRHYWIVRSVSGLLVIGGFIDLWRSLGRTTPHQEAFAQIADPRRPDAGTPRKLAIARMAYLSAFVAGVGFFTFSIVSLGVWPARTLEAQALAESPEVVVALTASEERGREIYAREGCAYCHTQQIRFTLADESRFGAPTLAWESRRDYPHMLGTRRIGPDLSRATGTRSDDWQLAHLFDPRSVVPESVMPAYTHLFDGSATAPTQAARDVVAYLDTLGRARRLVEPMAAISAHPASTRRTGRVPVLPASADALPGARLYAAHCASCHGETGRGDGPVAEALRPRPANLAAHSYTRERLAEALWHGVAGTSMPAWRDRPPSELAALASHVEALSIVGEDRAVTPEQRQLGQGVYVANCAQCHGDSGGGDGFAAAQLEVPPTNFQRQAPRVDYAIEVLIRGVDGTRMAEWSSRLSDDEIAGVAWYVTTLYRGQRTLRSGAQ